MCHKKMSLLVPPEDLTYAWVRHFELKECHLRSATPRFYKSRGNRDCLSPEDNLDIFCESKTSKVVLIKPETLEDHISIFQGVCLAF